MLIQIVLVAGVLLVGLYLARPAAGDSHLALRRLFMLGFVLVAVVSILFPQWLTWLANLIGVGRGTDLLLYALVLAFLVLNRKLTHLAREITIARAEAEDATRDLK